MKKIGKVIKEKISINIGKSNLNNGGPQETGLTIQTLLYSKNIWIGTSDIHYFIIMQC